jgi:hypothetical protein
LLDAVIPYLLHTIVPFVASCLLNTITLFATLKIKNWDNKICNNRYVKIGFQN